jgi:hypothetical protein
MFFHKGNRRNSFKFAQAFRRVCLASAALLVSAFGATAQSDKSTLLIWPAISCTAQPGPNGPINCFVAGSKYALFQMTGIVNDTTSSWSWTNLGGTLTSAPECVLATAPSTNDCFAAGAGSTIWHRTASSTPSAWANLGGKDDFYNPPSCVVRSSTAIDCFIRSNQASPDVLAQTTWNGKSATAWVNLGGVVTGMPNCVSWGPNRVDCFAAGAITASFSPLQHIWWNGKTWSAWENLGGTITASPSCVTRGTNLIDCFAIGNDNGLYQISFNGTWGAWKSLGGAWQNNTIPNCISPSPDRIDCFLGRRTSATQTAAPLYHIWWTNSAGTWATENLGGGIIAPPKCIALNASRIDCFVVGGDTAMWHIAWIKSNWSKWDKIGGGILVLSPSQHP